MSGDIDHGYPRVPWGAREVFPRFSQKDVGEGPLARLLAVARVAAPEATLQALRWIVVRGEGAKKYLESATYINAPLSSAPVILLCLADVLAWKSAPQFFEELIASGQMTQEEGREALRQLRDYYSSSPDVATRAALAGAFVAVHRMLSCAAECQLSAYWVTEFDQAKIKTHFHIPDHFLVAAVIPLGQHEEAAAAPAAKPLCVPIYQEKFGEVFNPE